MAPSGLALAIVVTVLWILVFLSPLRVRRALFQRRVLAQEPDNKAPKEEFMLRMPSGSTRPSRKGEAWPNGFYEIALKY
jgi:hypothetical protein